MSSSQAAQARAEAQAFIDRFASSGGLADPDADLARLSPEARLLAYERVLSLTPGSPTSAEKTLQMVAHLMRGGQATLRELGDNLASMSPQGRALALWYLTSHPQYRVRGLRWRPAPRRPGASVSADGGGPATPGTIRAVLESVSAGSPVTPGVAELGEYTAYQEVVDSVRALVDYPREEALSRVFESMSLAGAGDLTSAANVIRGAISTLDDLAANVSPLYRADVAVALYHLEAHLGEAGDNDGAERAICRSITLFRKCDDALPGAFTFDIALASMKLANCMARNGDYSDAVVVATAPIRSLEELAVVDFRAFGPALADRLSNLAVYQLRSGDVHGASETLDQLVATYEKLIARGVPVAPQLVQHARNLRLGADLQKAADSQRSPRKPAASTGRIPMSNPRGNMSEAAPRKNVWNTYFPWALALYGCIATFIVLVVLMSWIPSPEIDGVPASPPAIPGLLGILFIVLAGRQLYLRSQQK